MYKNVHSIIPEKNRNIYNLHRKVGDSYKYQMVFVHYDIATQACHLLNLEAISYDGMRNSWREVS